MADETLTFPPRIMFGDLKKCHVEYDIEKIEKHSDLYEGGDAFRSRIDRYLLKLQEESYSESELKSMYFASFNPKAESHGKKGEWDNKLQAYNGMKANYGKQWSARKARAWYVPMVAGLIDFMIAAIFQNPPSVVPGDDVEKKDDKASEDKTDILIGEEIINDEETTSQDYWRNLNLNVDGHNTSLRELLRNALLEVILNKRAYLCIGYDALMVTPSRHDDMKDAGGLDGRINLLKAVDVDDWGCDDGDNDLDWIRTHRCVFERSQPWKQPDLETHYWTYITEDAVYEYKLQFEKGKPPADETMVGNGTDDAIIKPYSTGFPIVQIPCDVWVMERLADIALSLFNRQASLTWSLDKAAYALLVLYTKRALQTVVDSSLGAVRLDPSDKAEFISADVQIPDMLLKDIERSKDELHAAVQAMVLQAASKDSGDRASGVAKQRDFGALATLLTPFAMSLKESTATVVRQIFITRKDKGTLILRGLNRYDVQNVEMKLTNSLTYLGMPGAPVTGKKFVIADTTLAMMSDAPVKLCEQAIEEIQKAELPEMQPDAVNALPPGIKQGQKPDDKISNPIGKQLPVKKGVA